MGHRNSGRSSSRAVRMIIMRIILWLITAALLAAGICLDGKGLVSYIFLGASVVLGIITVIFSFRWDGIKYKSESDESYHDNDRL